MWMLILAKNAYNLSGYGRSAPGLWMLSLWFNIPCILFAKYVFGEMLWEDAATTK